MRAVFAALAILLLPGCAHAQTAPDEQPAPIAASTANVIIQALAPSEYVAWAYQWDAVSIRVSRFVHWHIYEPDRRDRPTDAIVRRNGWLSEDGRNVGVSLYGTDDRVTELSVEYDAFNTLELLAALRAQGADVSFQADYESYSEYMVTPPGREAGLLTTRRPCTPENSRAAQRCHNEAMLTLEMPD